MRASPLSFFCWVSLAAAPAHAAPLLLTPIVAADLDEAGRVLLDDALRAEVVALGAHALVGRDEQAKACAAVPCDLALACTVARAKSAGAASVLVAERHAGAELLIRLTLFDAVAEVERSRVEVRGAHEEERALWRAAVVRVLAPDRFVGRVVVEVEGAEADVVIDGVHAGHTPMLAGVAVSPARHEIEVRAAGLEPYRSFINVPFDQIVKVRLVATSAALTEVAVPGAPPPAALPAPVEDGWPVGVMHTAGVFGAVVGGAALAGGAALTGVAYWQKARWQADQASLEVVRANRVIAPLGLALVGAGIAVGAAGAGLIVASTALAPDEEPKSPDQ